MIRRIYDDPAWKTVRRYVLGRDAYCCQVERDGELCGRVATAVDHITPLSENGAPFDPDNLRAACRSCNARISAQRRAELARQAIAGTAASGVTSPLRTSRAW